MVFGIEELKSRCEIIHKIFLELLFQAYLICKDGRLPQESVSETFSDRLGGDS